MNSLPIARAVAKRGRAWLEAQSEPISGLIDLSGDAASGTTPETVRDKTIDALRQHLGDHYTRRPGIAPLCKAVAAQLAAQGVDVDANNGVVVTGGPQEARFVALRTLAPGKTVYLPEVAPLPYYETAVRFADAMLERFDPEGDFPAASGGVLVLPNPNPATGQQLSQDTLERIARWAEQSKLTVIADETAAPLLRPEEPWTPFAALPGMAERTLTLGSFAAIPGIGAWQVAWFAGAKPLATAVRDLKQAITICSPAPSQYAALAGHGSDSEAAIQHVERLEAIVELLERNAIPFRQPHTVAYVVAEVAPLGGGQRVAAVCAAHGVRIADGAAFGAPDTVRIAVNADRFANALDGLDAAFAQLRRQEVSV